MVQLSFSPVVTPKRVDVCNDEKNKKQSSVSPFSSPSFSPSSSPDPWIIQAYQPEKNNNGIDKQIHDETTTTSTTPTSTNMQCHSLWYIDGIAYDLTGFYTIHPGGRSMLLACQGTDIATAMMVHHRLTPLTKKAAIAMVEKYRINPYQNQVIHTKGECQCDTLIKGVPTFEQSGMIKNNKDDSSSDSDISSSCSSTNDEVGSENATSDDMLSFHDELTKRVKKWTRANGYDPKLKAEWMDHLILLGIWSIQIGCVYGWYTYGWHLLGIISGIIWMVLGFVGMHAASHFGYSSNPFINDLICFAWCCWGGWLYPLWMRHHVISHHLYTGVYKVDVDIAHFNPFGRKHPKQRQGLFGRYQHIFLPILAGIFIGQYIGQVIAYIRSILTGRLFGSSITKHTWNHQLSNQIVTFIASISVCVQTIIIINLFLKYGILHTIITLLCFAFGLNFGYWSLVAPNHDTELAHPDDEVVHINDWSIQQLDHSSDFLVPSYLSYLMGGMNYQIEHHLFPCVHPKYYPGIHTIVNQLAKERNIKHNIYTSWSKAIISHIRYLKKVA